MADEIRQLATGLATQSHPQSRRQTSHVHTSRPLVSNSWTVSVRGLRGADGVVQLRTSGGQHPGVGIALAAAGEALAQIEVLEAWSTSGVCPWSTIPAASPIWRLLAPGCAAIAISTRTVR